MCCRCIQAITKVVMMVISLLLSSFFPVCAQDWEPLPTGTGLDLLGLQRLAPGTLIFFGDDGILLKTVNGGVSFSSVQNPSAFIYTEAFFRNTDTGFVANGSGNIMRTYNAGNNWVNTGGCTCFVTSICFSNSMTGVYGGLTGVYRSLDGGTSWSSISGAPYFVPEKMVAFSDSVFIAAYHLSIYKSTDYGATWQFDTVNFNSNYYLAGLSFIDAQNGFAISGDGYLFATNNQGETWSEVAGTGLDAGGDLLFTDSQHGYALSGQYDIYETSDGGQSWTLDYSSSSVLSGLAGDSNAVYACGHNGLVLKKELTTGMENPAAGIACRIIPNPTQKEITITGISNIERVAVYNAMGVLVYTADHPEKGRMNITMLPPGIYAVHFTSSMQSDAAIFEKF